MPSPGVIYKVNRYIDIYLHIYIYIYMPNFPLPRPCPTTKVYCKASLPGSGCVCGGGVSHRSSEEKRWKKKERDEKINKMYPAWVSGRRRTTRKKKKKKKNRNKRRGRQGGVERGEYRTNPEGSCMS